MSCSHAPGLEWCNQCLQMQEAEANEARREQIASLTTRVEEQSSRIEELESRNATLEGAEAKLTKELVVIKQRADKTLLEADDRRDLEDGLSLIGLRVDRALHPRVEDAGRSRNGGRGDG